MANRLQQLRAKMQELDLDAFLISSVTNLRYLFGFSGSNGLALVTESHCLFITDRRYRDQVQQEAQGAEIHIAQGNLFEPLKSSQRVEAGKRLAFEANHLTFRNFSRLQKLLPKAKLVAAENIIEEITIPRLPHEVEKIRQACAIAARVWEEILPMIGIGMAELDLAAEISYRCKKAGADGDAFEPIVASGWRSALPHGLASRKTLQPGELVVIDFGCSVDGFKSDVTRTIALGEPKAQQRHMVDTVLQANRVAREALHAGMEAVELDKIARKFLAANGYKKEFSHSLGHGLGLDVHSLPRIGERSADSIPQYCVVAIEPGVYIAGVGGVRIEDDVYLADAGPELLTHIERELVVIE